GTLRLGDEAYPKRRRVGMGFGERKAHFLAIRPKPKYATWIGRKKGIIEAKARPKPNDAAATVITDQSMFPDHSVRAHTKYNDKEEQPHKGNEMTKDKTEIDKPGGEKVERTGEEGKKKIETTTNKDEKKEKAPKPAKKDEKKKYHVVQNINFLSPLKPDGQPFWCGDIEEVNDEDLPVDMDILEKICSGEKMLCQRPFNKIEFSPFGQIAAMKADDVLFVRNTMLFANTVESVISLQPEDDKKKKLPPALPYKLKWSDQVRVIMFHPTVRTAHNLEKSWVEQFHMVTRDKK
uniref:RNA helicase n=1 Tax=Panagrolaimus sp. PS1159 TaxID=55785 RepID=A0AC35GN80_9BILA